MNFRKQNGITLIALVITIIVLLILAAISITALTDEDKGVVTKAKQAALKTEEATKKEDDDIKEIMDYADSENIIEPEDNITKPENNGEGSVTEPKCSHENTELRNETSSYTGDIYCADCNILISYGTEKSDALPNIGDYVNYPVYYNNVKSAFGNGVGYTPANYYQGWRVLSIENINGEKYIKLVSDGIPLTFFRTKTYATYSTTTDIAIENLTTKFFQTPISTSTHNSFHLCGFKTSSNGSVVTNINSVKALFANEFTQTYGTTGATYTDDSLGQTFTNLAAKGDPMVMSITKDDLDKLAGYEIANNGDVTSLEHIDLVMITSTSSSFQVDYWLATSYSTGLWVEVGDHIGLEGNIGSSSDRIFGVRPVVCLKPGVQFYEADTNINGVQTWDIDI